MQSVQVSPKQSQFVTYQGNILSKQEGQKIGGVPGKIQSILTKQQTQIQNLSQNF